MTIRELLNYATKRLKPKSTSPTLDAEVLLAFTLKKPKEYLCVNYKLKITNDKFNHYKSLIQKRAAGWPVAYLTHHKEFFGLDFYVDKHVLIPRPETEGLVELTLEKVKSQRSKVKILDVGTGSGCIIISLACNLQPKSYNFFASDISPAALRVARKNARQHRVKISFKQSDLLTGWKNEHFDIIIANLPYLAKETDPSTRFEPKEALIAKKQGLVLIEKLFQQISTLNAQPAALFLEIGHDQGLRTKKLAARLLPAYEIKILNDWAQRPRYALLQKKSF